MGNSVEVITIDTENINSRRKSNLLFYINEIERCEVNRSYIVRGMWLSILDHARKGRLRKELDRTNTLESYKRILYEYESIQGISEQKLVPSLFNLSENLKKPTLLCPDFDISSIFPLYIDRFLVLNA